MRITRITVVLADHSDYKPNGESVTGVFNEPKEGAAAGRYYKASETRLCDAF